METSYLPVPWVHREVIEEEIEKGTKGKIFYFAGEKLVDSAEGRIKTMEDIPGKGMFITLEPEKRIRIDRIITLFGMPAAAYEEYNAFADSCMDCMGGYEKEDLE